MEGELSTTSIVGAVVISNIVSGSAVASTTPFCVGGGWTVLKAAVFKEPSSHLGARGRLVPPPSVGMVLVEQERLQQHALLTVAIGFIMLALKTIADYMILNVPPAAWRTIMVCQSALEFMIKLFWMLL